MESNERPWTTIKRAASLLEVSEKTIRRMVEGGWLDHFQPTGPRGQIRIYLDSIEEAKRRRKEVA